MICLDSNKYAGVNDLEIKILTILTMLKMAIHLTPPRREQHPKQVFNILLFT